jgi:hypothetical protein
MRTAPERVFRAVAPDTDPLKPTWEERRATAAGTGGFYCAVEPETCLAEVQEYLPNPQLHEIRIDKQVQILDLAAYCSGEGKNPEHCYAGERSLSKTIHSFFGQGVQGMSWESQKREGGTCIVLLIENIASFFDGLQSRRVT